ncbi:MAG: YraN family protein [Ruminococcaceae bacterium]|nr:YraN family protein [Oscillospiraceae bacterium]
MIKNKTGVWGELYAARYLRDRNYEILGTNYTCRFGEIDIIARKNGTVCFVEVKTRNEKTAIRPMEAVDNGKTERLEMAAKNFVSYAKIKENLRFDVCEVYVDNSNKLKNINYIENAF